jgi:hypothetical protein
MSPFRRSLALATLFAYLALSTLGASWVVCSGSDGHVALEARTAGCCGDDAGEHPADEDAPRDDCGDCDDVLVNELAAARETQDDPFDDVLAPTLVASFAAAAALPAPAAANAAARSPPRPPPERVHLTCTVLLL